MAGFIDEADAVRAQLPARQLAFCWVAPARATSTLSTRRPSMSMTSKRQPPHSNQSLAAGMRPNWVTTKPPSV